MTTPRMVQNFRQSHGILWADKNFDAETLERTLLKLGVGLTRVDDPRALSLDHNRDVVFIDGDLPFDSAALAKTGTILSPAPSIGIVGVEAPSRLKLLAEVGVTAFLRKPIHASAIYSALFLGVNNHRRMRAMEERLAEQDRRRHGRRFVIKAVVALVQRHGLTDDEAFAALRRESMRQRIGLEDFCAAILADGGGSFPHRWPANIGKNHSQAQIGEGIYATHSDDERGDLDADGPDRRQSSSAYQDRRA
jgi:AmiR/NasT family two-component response regulator